MITWHQAHRLANLAAAQAHGDLEIETASPPIDVYGAICDAGVVLAWRPMPRQFGAYFNETGSRPGILVNSGLDHAARRHTAGHELGHHRFGHASRLDTDLDPPSLRGTIWTDEEKAAEAFAVWFLMPRRAVQAGLERLRMGRPRSPDDAYRLSLLLGTSYRSTVRHLPNLKLVSPRQARAWAAVPPNRIKVRLDQTTTPPGSRRPDVWVVDEGFDQAKLTLHAGDRLVITTTDMRGEVTGHSSGLTLLQTTPLAVSLDGIRDHDCSPGRTFVLEVAGAAGTTGQVRVVRSLGVGSSALWGFA